MAGQGRAEALCDTALLTQIAKKKGGDGDGDGGHKPTRTEK